MSGEEYDNTGFDSESRFGAADGAASNSGDEIRARVLERARTKTAANRSSKGPDSHSGGETGTGYTREQGSMATHSQFVPGVASDTKSPGGIRGSNGYQSGQDGDDNRRPDQASYRLQQSEPGTGKPQVVKGKKSETFGDGAVRGKSLGKSQLRVVAGNKPLTADEATNSFENMKYFLDKMYEGVDRTVTWTNRERAECHIWRSMPDRDKDRVVTQILQEAQQVVEVAMVVRVVNRFITRWGFLMILLPRVMDTGRFYIDHGGFALWFLSSLAQPKSAVANATSMPS